jgi:hypothetical protein
VPAANSFIRAGGGHFSPQPRRASEGHASLGGLSCSAADSPSRHGESPEREREEGNTCIQLAFEPKRVAARNTPVRKGKKYEKAQ